MSVKVTAPVFEVSSGVLPEGEWNSILAKIVEIPTVRYIIVNPQQYKAIRNRMKAAKMVRRLKKTKL